MRFPALVIGSLMLTSCVVSNDQTFVSRAPEASEHDADQLVAARQAGMRMMVFTLASVSRAAENEEAPLDRAGFGIGGIKKWGEALPVLFDEATAPIAGTKALPAIWTDPEGFEERVQQFQVATTELAATAAANDRAAFAEALASTKAACKACHDSYRVADD
ncbi:MAG: cytochrome c [Erythrobacter sp.]